MSTKLFIGIAVRDATGMQTLPGVWKSVADMSAWAAQAGYRSVVVTDQDGQPVTVERIATAVKAQLQSGLDRIMLYFAGHGFSVPPDQYLILSAGPDVPRQRITRNGFRDMLATYAPKQISVITDACQSMRKFVGLADSVLDPSGAEAKTPTFDGFYAAQEGSQAFAFHATANAPELCVFTWVVHRGLTFENSAAAIETAGGVRVTSGSLADYLDRSVPAEAAAHNVWQQPITNTGFRPPNDVYSERVMPGVNAKAISVARAGVPPAPASASRARPIQDLRRRIVSEWRAPFQDWAFARAALIGDGLLIDYAGEDLLINRRHALFDIGRGTGSPARHIEPFNSPGDGHAAERRAVAIPGDAFRNFDRIGRSHTVLISVDRYSVLVPMHQGLWCALRMDARRDEGNVTDVLTWGSPYDNSKHSDSLSPLEVLKGLLLGRIRIDDARHIAAAVRYGKHRDPLMGIVAAYLYDSVGDVDNNRRMCWYYGKENQDVPFDIALLARAPIESVGNSFVVHVPATHREAGNGPEFTLEATPAETIRIAGIAPVLRAGWAQLHAMKHPLYQQLASLSDELTSDAIATFKGNYARDKLAWILETQLGKGG
jgi:hypothetical protein